MTSKNPIKDQIITHSALYLRRSLYRDDDEGRRVALDRARHLYILLDYMSDPANREGCDPVAELRETLDFRADFERPVLSKDRAKLRADCAIGCLAIFFSRTYHVGATSQIVENSLKRWGVTSERFRAALTSDIESKRGTAK